MKTAEVLAELPRQHGHAELHQVDGGGTHFSLLVDGVPGSDEKGHVRNVHPNLRRSIGISSSFSEGLIPTSTKGEGDSWLGAGCREGARAPSKNASQRKPPGSHSEALRADVSRALVPTTGGRSGCLESTRMPTTPTQCIKVGSIGDASPHRRHH